MEYMRSRAAVNGNLPEADLRKATMLCKMLTGNATVCAGYGYLIRTITRDNDANQRLCGDAVIKQLLHVLVTHPNNLSVNDECVLACRSLAIGSDASKRSIVRLGGVAVMVSAMVRHGSNPDFAHRTVNTLAHMITIPEVCPVLIGCSGLQVILMMIETNFEVMEVVHACVDLLRRVCTHTDGLVAMVSNPFTPLLTRVRERYHDSEALMNEVKRLEKVPTHVYPHNN